MSKYDVNAIREKLKKSQAGKFSDPDQFKPDKGKDNIEPIKYRFYILPPIMKGDILKSGEVKKSMDQFFIQHANHWVDNKPHPCPRVWSDDDCKICNFGFELLNEEKNKGNDKDKRSKILQQWMPATYNMVNIYFTSWKGNPEDLRNKVKWYNGPKTCFDQWISTLMKEDMGDSEDPQAFGVFFDENAGFVYELQVLKQGSQNSYKTSRFLPNSGVAHPMVCLKDNKPNKKGLETLLKLRHNLWDKIEIPDANKINKVYSIMTNADDPDDNGGFDQDETITSEPVAESTVGSALEDEGPVDEGPVDGGPVDGGPVDGGPVDGGPVDEGPVVTENVSEVPVVVGDVDGDEIDDLLSQLDDEN